MVILPYGLHATQLMMTTSISPRQAFTMLQGPMASPIVL
jgi:hypothetical protein